MIGFLVLLLLGTLWLTRSKRGNKVAEKIMMRLLKTRFGTAAAQLADPHLREVSRACRSPTPPAVSAPRWS